MFEWGGISVDPNRQVAIANPMALPFVSKLIPRGPGNPMEPPKDAKGSGTESGVQPQYGVPYGVTPAPSDCLARAGSVLRRKAAPSGWR